VELSGIRESKRKLRKKLEEGESWGKRGAGIKKKLDNYNSSYSTNSGIAKILDLNSRN
jgi:hypothetical protein